MMLATLEETKAALRIDGDDDDAALDLAIRAASAGVVAYLKSGADGFVADGELIDGAEVPPNVKIATIYWTGVLRRNPDNNVESEITPGYPPAPVVSLLYQMRDPACA